MVGTAAPDDAAIYRLTDDTALIQTVDFFPPIVDDPYMFGQIAAANALSDVYAMGGEPLTAMNIVCFPSRKLGFEVLKQILRGGADKVAEAGALLVGGHTIEDDEPKYGLAVTGLVHPLKIWTKKGSRPGDKLILTKPLGCGVIATALKAGMASDEAVQEISRWMAHLNRGAAAAFREVGINACTDITGFGLLGHAQEMAGAGEVGMRFYTERIPVLAEARDLAEQGLLPGGAHANRRFLKDCVCFSPSVSETIQDILFDPQTSGGLLAAVPPDRVDRLLELLRKKDLSYAAVIGEVTSGPKGVIEVE